MLATKDRIVARAVFAVDSDEDGARMTKPTERLTLDYRNPTAAADPLISDEVIALWQAPPRSPKAVRRMIMVRAYQMCSIIFAMNICIRFSISTKSLFLIWMNLLVLFLVIIELFWFCRRSHRGDTIFVTRKGFGFTHNSGKSNTIDWPDLALIYSRHQFFGLVPYGDLKVRVYSHGNFETLLRMYDISVVREAAAFLELHWNLYKQSIESPNP